MPKPKISISTYVDSYGGPVVDSSYQKKEIKRLEEAISCLENELSDFDKEKAAKMVKASLEAELATKKARLTEQKTRKRLNLA